MYKDTQKAQSIQNTIWKLDSTYKFNPMRAMCRDISKYPPPLYGNEFFSLIEDDSYFPNKDASSDTKIYVTLLGRGCIGKCIVF